MLSRQIAVTDLQPSEGMVFESGKVYTHSVGLSCCFRQWRAKESHCRFLHGYALQVSVTFRSTNLDHRNWVMDFGGLKWLKVYLENNFDHKTLVARDDPELSHFIAMDTNNIDGKAGLFDLKVVEHVGCEAFAKMIYEHIMSGLTHLKIPWVYVQEVEVREHEGNFARYKRGKHE